jgi:hypothetical protein
MPTVWHQALLALAQGYKNQLTPANRESLKQVMRVYTHKQITPVIRKELFAPSPCTHASSGCGAVPAIATTIPESVDNETTT